jgi:hypothetical protein
MIDGLLGNVGDWKQKMHISIARSPVGVPALVGTADPGSLFAAAYPDVFDGIATASHHVGTSTSWPHR